MEVNITGNKGGGKLEVQGTSIFIVEFYKLKLLR